MGQTSMFDAAIDDKSKCADIVRKVWRNNELFTFTDPSFFRVEMSRLPKALALEQQTLVSCWLSAPTVFVGPVMALKVMLYHGKLHVPLDAKVGA